MNNAIPKQKETARARRAVLRGVIKKKKVEEQRVDVKQKVWSTTALFTTSN